MRVAIVVIGAGLAWTIVANTVSDSLAEREPEVALRWRDNADALIALAQESLQRDGAKVATASLRNLANQALDTTPLESRALWVLGSAAEIDGDVAAAKKFMLLAGERSRRDPVVQTWLFYQLSREARFAEALDYADALLRARPNRRESIAPTLMAYALDGGALPALASRLATDPPWRGWYLAEIGRQTAHPGAAYALFETLKEKGSPPSAIELRPHLDALVTAGLFEQAYLTWIHYLPEEKQRRVSFAYNGDFDFPVTGLPFDWVIDPLAGASTTTVEAGDDAGRMVEITFAGRRAPYRHLRKLMMLPPGRYRLDGKVRAEAIDNERGLSWQVSCAEGEKQRLGETSPLLGTLPWQAFTAEFEVPNETCRAQWLTLVLRSRAALEETISGRIWFDDIAVARAGAATTAQR